MTWTNTDDGGREACVRHVSLVMVDGRVCARAHGEVSLSVSREWDTATDWWGRGWRWDAFRAGGRDAGERHVRTRAEALRRAEAWHRAEGERLAAEAEAGR